MIAGIDFSTRAVDIVLLDEDSYAATWHRFELTGQDAFERARSVRPKLPFYTSEFWDDVLAVGIEEPRGYGAGSLYRIQGAILACIPRGILVHPLIPSAWRKTVGLPGNATKSEVANMAHSLMSIAGMPFDHFGWPIDATDAYCIALATRSLLVTEDAAA